MPVVDFRVTCAGFPNSSSLYCNSIIVSNCSYAATELVFVAKCVGVVSELSNTILRVMNPGILKQ